MLFFFLPFSGHYLGMAFERVHAKVTTTICLNACSISKEFRATKSAEFQISGISHEEPSLLLSDMQDQGSI